MYNFKKYSEEKPPEEGLYIWRVPHKKFKDAIVIFISRFRKRGAGCTDILSPDFDYWDGYQVHLPKNIEWAYYDSLKPKKNRTVLSVNNLKPIQCPFCHKSPILSYYDSYVGSGPLATESWAFKCCKWINSPRVENPLELFKLWNEKLDSLGYG